MNRLIEAIEKSFAVVEKKEDLSATPVAPPAEPASIRPPESKDPPEARSQQDSVATAKDPTTPVKSVQTTPAIPPAASISATAALKESGVWTRKRLIMVSAIGTIVILLLALAGFLRGPNRFRKAADSNAIRIGDYQKRADHGDANAQYQLGSLYEKGEGVPKDLGKAAELNRKAADQGNQQAIANLERLYKLAKPKLTDQSDAQIESLRSFHLAFLDQFAVPRKRFNADAFYAKLNEGDTKFEQAIADEKFTARRPVLFDLKAQFDADARHLYSKTSVGKATPTLASEMKKDVNTIYDHALGR